MYLSTEAHITGHAHFITYMSDSAVGWDFTQILDRFKHLGSYETQKRFLGGS
jgi:hypothetical protein